jgi:hypothetical protein
MFLLSIEMWPLSIAWPSALRAVLTHTPTLSASVPWLIVTRHESSGSLTAAPGGAFVVIPSRTLLRAGE